MRVSMVRFYAVDANDNRFLLGKFVDNMAATVYLGSYLNVPEVDEDKFKPPFTNWFIGQDGLGRARCQAVRKSTNQTETLELYIVQAESELPAKKRAVSASRVCQSIL